MFTSSKYQKDRNSKILHHVGLGHETPLFYVFYTTTFFKWTHATTFSNLFWVPKQLEHILTSWVLRCAKICPKNVLKGVYLTFEFLHSFTFYLPHRFGFDRWVLMILIGILIGLMAAMLKQCLTALATMKWDKTKEFAHDNEVYRSFAWTAGISVILVVVSSVSVTVCAVQYLVESRCQMVSILLTTFSNAFSSLKMSVLSFIEISLKFVPQIWISWLHFLARKVVTKV